MFKDSDMYFCLLWEFLKCIEEPGEELEIFLGWFNEYGTELNIDHWKSIYNSILSITGQ